MTEPNNGTFVWFELLTTEPLASVEFYQHVLGWTSQRLAGVHGHVMYASSEGPLASATTLPELAKQMGAPPFWTANVQIPSVDETCMRVKLLGGRVYHGPVDVAGIGRIAVIADPFGAVLNVFAPAKPMKAHDPALPGEVCWHELLSDDPARSLAFYGELFGWAKSGEHAMGALGTYTLFGCGGRDLGGMFKRPKDVPVSAWVYYFQVRDVDAAIARCAASGGRLCRDPMAVPSGARVAQLVDPQGAVFAVHENPKQAVAR